MDLSSESVAFNKSESEDLELPSFDFERIAIATCNFSHDKKLGEGGFGPVHKVIIDTQHVHYKLTVFATNNNVSQYGIKTLSATSLSVQE